MPLVSVIIPCYNYAHFLPETLESIRQQTFSDWECLLIDDGSTDNTSEVAQIFVQQDYRFRYIQQANSGPSVARNKGIHESRGEFIQFLDADDLIQPHKLKLQIDVILQKPEIDILYGDIRFFLDKSPHIFLKSLTSENTPYPMPRLVNVSSFDTFKALYNYPLHPSALLIRKKFLLDKNVFFNETYRTSCVEDWHFFIWAAIRQSKFHYIDQEGGYGLVRSHSMSTNNTEDRTKSDKLIKFRAIMLDLLAEELISSKILLETEPRIIAQLLGYRYCKEFTEGSIKKAFYFFFKGYKYVPNKMKWIKDAFYYFRRRIMKGKINW